MRYQLLHRIDFGWLVLDDVNRRLGAVEFHSCPTGAKAQKYFQAVLVTKSCPNTRKTDSHADARVRFYLETTYTGAKQAAEKLGFR